ncbi:MAG: Crp/Fnr family transcriptional regulator [Proteobacteria bacterium]|nr:Crp/Fnr family transcriptional regulator [Pseudomonadota bacterium]NOG61759.1 Crp/Fnr family transcriptional regulator [Pseudomonadota bacterium]
MNKQIIKTLQITSLFEGLNEVQLEQICDKSKLISFKKDEVIFCQGDEAHVFFIIIQGWVTIAKENKNAEQSILHVFKEGESFAEPAALIMKRYPASAYAASNCQLLEINLTSLKKMIQADPDIAMRMVARLTSQLNTLINEFEKYKTMDVPRRLALFLLELMEKNPGNNSVDLPCNKTVLAAHLGVQPGTLSRAFNHLLEYGVMSDRSSHIIIEDIEMLKKYTEQA